MTCSEAFDTRVFHIADVWHLDKQSFFVVLFQYELTFKVLYE